MDNNDAKGSLGKTRISTSPGETPIRGDSGFLLRAGQAGHPQRGPKCSRGPPEKGGHRHLLRSWHRWGGNARGSQPSFIPSQSHFATTAVRGQGTHHLKPVPPSASGRGLAHQMGVPAGTTVGADPGTSENYPNITHKLTSEARC